METDESVTTSETEAEVKSLGADSSNALGVFDMSGNVYEWCFTENIQRIIRGGSWAHSADDLLISIRSSLSPDDERHFQGFRLCRTAD